MIMRLYIDSVLTNRHVSKKYTKELTEKLAAEGGKFFKNNIRHVIALDDWQKEDGHVYFLNIEIIADAIDKNRQIEFTYNYYGTDKKLHPKGRQSISPYQLLLKNGNYYLICNYEKYSNMAFLRVDKMSDIEITDKESKNIEKVEGYENGIDLGKLSNKLPYMYDDEAERIVLAVKNGGTNIIDAFMEWFGRDNFTVEDKDGELHFTVYASHRAMRFWILQFGKYLKVLSPQSLADVIKNDIDEMKKLYEKN